MPTMNSAAPNTVQLHAGRLLNGQASVQNFHASRSQLPYVDSVQHSVFANGGDFANMDPRIVNFVGNYASGGSTGKQSNTARIRAPGHLPHLTSTRSGGPADRNVQGTNLPMDTTFAQGLMQRQNAGLYHQNQDFSIQKEDFPALPGFRGSTMGYPAAIHPKEQLHDYAVSQLHTQHLSGGQSPGYRVGQSPGYRVAGPYLASHQQQLPTAVSSAGVNILQANNDNRLQSHVPDLLPSTLPGYHTTAHNMELAGGGMKLLNPSGLGVGPYDEVIRQFELHQQSQLQMQQMQAADAFTAEDHTAQRPPQQPLDPFGLLGLLHKMKPGRPTPLSVHSVGIDLTTMGLNLVQSEDLHKDFLSPLYDLSLKDVQDPKFTVPECYNAVEVADLQPACFPYFRVGTLFYIFYSMPKDVAQLYAANELMNREWIYHKEHRLWLIQDKKKPVLVRTDTYERRAIFFFDPNEWKIFHQENFVLKYESIEKRPALPTRNPK